MMCECVWYIARLLAHLWFQRVSWPRKTHMFFPNIIILCQSLNISYTYNPFIYIHIMVIESLLNFQLQVRLCSIYVCKGKFSFLRCHCMNQETRHQHHTLSCDFLSDLRVFVCATICFCAFNTDSIPFSGCYAMSMAKWNNNARINVARKYFVTT